MSQTAKKRWLWIAFFALCYLLPLGFRPMVVPDEFRYAEVPREMLESGEWSNPQLMGVPYYEKPAFGYQLTALSFRVFGENRFALRLPPALGAALGAWVIYLLLRGYLRRKAPLASEDPALLAAGLYLLCGLVYGVGTFAVLDSQLTGMITLSIGAFFLATTARDRKRCCGWLLVCGMAAGFALLIKGLLGVAVPGMVIGGWLLWQLDWKKILLWPWLPLAALTAVVAPWAWAQHQAQPDFWTYFIQVEHLDRFLKGTSDSSPEPFWYFLPVFLGGMLPAGLWLPAAIKGWCGRWRSEFFRDPFWRLTLLWWALPFLFFSTSSAKLGTYILPCFVPFALWLGYGLWQPDAANRIQDWIWRVLGMVLTAGGTAFGIYQLLADFGCWPGLFARGESWWMLGVPFGVTWGAILWRNWRASLHRQCYIFFAGCAGMLLIGPLMMPEALIGEKMPEKILAEFMQEGYIEPDSVVVVDRSTMHAVAWCWKRADVLFWGTTGEITGFKVSDAYKDRRVSHKEAGVLELRKRIPPGKGVAVTRDDADAQAFPASLQPNKLEYKSGIWVAKF